MPRVPVADRRALVDQFDREIAGRSCRVFVYTEAHSGRPVRRLFWKTAWVARHVRVEVPRADGRVKYIHDTRNRFYGGRFPDVYRSEQVAAAVEKAETWIQRQQALAEAA